MISLSDLHHMIKAIIIDDEQPARDLIRYFLKDFTQIEIVDECNNGFEGYKSIESHKPDLIFLDIRMPKITGFELLEMIENPPRTIFSTAYDEYAIKAFEQNAVDYLMKPYSKERFDVAVEKALKSLESEEEKPDISQLTQGVNEDSGIEKIVVKNGNRIQIIQLPDILYFEGQDDYVAIHTSEGKFLKQLRLKHLEESLPGDFLRVHRSFIIRIDRLKKIEAYTKDSHLATLDDSSQVPVSRSGYARLKEVLNI